MRPDPADASLHSLLAREQRAPRYTSYPTALEFRDDFDRQDYLRAVSHTNEEPLPAPLSLYLHIPFCQSACFYCGCHRIINRNPEDHEIYLDHLCREIEIQASLFAPDRPVQQIHFGGGTPNILRPRQLGRLLNQIRRHFSLSDDCEISLEADPRQYRPRDATAWALLGFNRLSLGIQDMHPSVQKHINRRQDPKGIRLLVDEARRAGIDSLNFDLIYGLPLQTLERFELSLDFVCELRPERVALFHYAHMPLRFPAQKAMDATRLPSLSEAYAMLQRSQTVLGEAGYRHLGMDHFALPQDSLSRAQADGRLRRNFQGYSVLGDCDLIGLGVSAISQVGKVYAQNHSGLPDYLQAIDFGELAIRRGLSKDHDDQWRAALIEKIMCQTPIDVADFEDRWNVDLNQDLAEELAALERLAPDQTWLARDKKKWMVTEQGQPFLRLLAQCFDRYTAQRQSRGRPVQLLDMQQKRVP